ncbi:MAG: UbiA family prenyltransferase, partial [Flavobacteriales bacterium]|nr:UbiA family prenyltransferase [Flavobacteriales bacterium]
MNKYFSLIKFSHTIFAMPFAFIGFFLATKSHELEWINLVYVILCMVFARSAAMAFNRYIDRDIDKANKRTSETREIPNGSIKANSVLIFVIINSLLFIGTTF